LLFMFLLSISPIIEILIEEKSKIMSRSLVHAQCVYCLMLTL
jgi:hypothetical protein